MPILYFGYYFLQDQCNMEEIHHLVEYAIARYGKMEKMLSDRGFVFHGWRGINRFERFLDDMDISHIHTFPHHPETIGKVESVSKAVQKELHEERKLLVSRVNELELQSLVLGAAKWEFIENEDKKSVSSTVWVPI